MNSLEAGAGATPDPIPNSLVKPLVAQDSPSAER